ncbi:unnamed protein product [Ectocarpus sp. CCAP 1310/34]|nr:unnamed protein product [Ectocarpus sp. CCAP 1310/34]
MVALEDLADDSQNWPYYMYDNDDDGASKAQSRSPLPPPGHAAGGTLAVDQALSSKNGTGRSGAAAAAAIAAGFLHGREQAARQGVRPVRTCCLRRCSKKWPLEKLAQARSGVPIGVSSIRGPPLPDGDGGGGGGSGGGDDGGGITVCAALRKAYLKGCFSRDGGLFYITGGRSSLPVCPLFFSAVTGIPAGVVESAVQEFLQGTKRRSYSRAPRASSIANISARLAPSPSPGSREPVPDGWRYSTATERCYSRTAEPWGGIGADYSNHQLPCESSKVIQAFITDLASHWQPLGESNRVEMSYPSRKAIYDLFARDWERQRQDGVAEQPKNLRRWTPTPSYGVFVATWDRWCGHVGLKQSGNHQHEQEHQQYHHRHHHQEHQQLLQQQHPQQQQHHHHQQDRC